MDCFPSCVGNPVENQATGETPAFETFASVIRSSLNEFFPAADNEHVNIIGEPGRYMATAWSTLFTIVQGRHVHQSSQLTMLAAHHM